MNTERTGTRSWVISGLLALIAFVAVFPMLTGNQGVGAAALEGIAVTGDEAIGAGVARTGVATIPFTVVATDDNNNPANGGSIITTGVATMTHNATAADDDYIYFGALEPFNTIAYDRNAAGNDASAIESIEVSTAANTMGGTAVVLREEDVPFATDNQSIDFDPPATGWVAANMSFDPVAGRLLYWARVDFAATQDAGSFTAVTYAPLRLNASSGAAGSAGGATVIAGTSGVANSFTATGAKFFNGLTGVTTTGGVVEAAIATGLAVSAATFFGDGTAGTASISAVGDSNTVSVTGGLQKVGAAATITMTPTTLTQVAIAANVAAGTMVATVKDAAGEKLLAGTNVLFTLDGAAVFSGGLQVNIVATVDAGTSTLATTFSSTTATSGSVTATSGTATAGAATYRVNGPSVTATLIPVSMDAVGGADQLFAAGTTSIVLGRSGDEANLRVSTVDAAGNPVASAAAGTLGDTSTVDIVLDAGVDALAITQTGVPTTGLFGDNFAVEAGATATLGKHTVTVDYPKNGTTAAFSSSSIEVHVVSNTATALSTAASGDGAGPGDFVTVTATLTSADGDTDGALDPAPDSHFITWTTTAGTILDLDQDSATAGVQTGTRNGIATVRILSTGAAAAATVTATHAALPISTTAISFTAAAVAAAPAAASVAVTAGDTSLTVGDSTTVTATVTNDDDSVGAGATGRWSEGVAVSTVTSNVKTTDAAGATSTTYTADAAGDTVVTFTVVSLSGGIVVDTAVSGSVTISATAPAVAAPTTAEQLSSTTGYAAWIGSESSTASAVYADVTSATIIWHWNGTAWESYATVGGTELPGSVNFTIALGSILYFG